MHWLALVIAIAVCLGFTSGIVAQSAMPNPLQLERKMALGNVSGRIDHMAVDLAHRRLFVAELGNERSALSILMRKKSCIASAVHRDLIISLAAKHKLPAVYYPTLLRLEQAAWPPTGLIISRPTSAVPLAYVDRILKGEKPADLTGTGPQQNTETSDQPQNRQGTRNDRFAADATRARRRGDRIRRMMSAIGTKRT